VIDVTEPGTPPKLGRVHVIQQVIDELVEDGRTGWLVKAGDVAGLAEAIIQAWRGESGMERGFVWSGDLRDMMQPEVAAGELVGLIESWGRISA